MREFSLIVLAIFVAAWCHPVVQGHHVINGPEPHVHGEHHDHSAEVFHDVVSPVSVTDEHQSPDPHGHSVHAHYSTAIFRNAAALTVAPIPVLGIAAPVQCWSDTGPSGLAVKRGLSLQNPLKPTGLLTTILRR